LAITPDSRRLYVAFQSGGPGGSRGHDAIARFDVLSGRLERSIAGLPNVGCEMAISPDGRWLWQNACDACSGRTFDRVGCPAVPAGTIHVFDLRTEQLVRTLTFPGLDPRTIHFSADSRLAVVNGRSLLIFDTRRLQTIAAFHDRPDGYGPAAFVGTRLYALSGSSLLAYTLAAQ
jgi:hypothetical protein